jgi:hypothetical protein
LVPPRRCGCGRGTLTGLAQACAPARALASGAPALSGGSRQRPDLGIEVTQLLAVALMMPSLYVLSRTAAYGAVRVTVAVIGVLLSGAWLVERTTLITSDPCAAVSNALIAHPFTVAAAFALLAAAARYGELPAPVSPRRGALSPGERCDQPVSVRLKNATTPGIRSAAGKRLAWPAPGTT